MLTTPWEQITDNAYKSWLLEALTIEEFNAETPRNRRALLTDFKQQQQQQQRGPTTPRVPRNKA